MKYNNNVTDLRQVEWLKSQLETAIDALVSIKESTEYSKLKNLIVKQTGGLEFEDVLMDVQCFSRGVDDLETIAMQK